MPIIVWSSGVFSSGHTLAVVDCRCFGHGSAPYSPLSGGRPLARYAVSAAGLLSPAASLSRRSSPRVPLCGVCAGACGRSASAPSGPSSLPSPLVMTLVATALPTTLVVGGALVGKRED